MSQVELAEAARVTASTVSLIEGCRRQPSLQVLQAIALAMQIPLSLMIFLTEVPEDFKHCGDAYVDVAVSFTSWLQLNFTDEDLAESPPDLA